MTENEGSDAESPPRYENSNIGYEKVDVYTSDIGIHRRSIASEDLPSSYSATWDGDLEESYDL